MRINQTVLELVFMAVFLACAVFLWVDFHNVGSTMHWNDEVMKQNAFIVTVNARIEAQNTNRSTSK